MPDYFIMLTHWIQWARSQIELFTNLSDFNIANYDVQMDSAGLLGTSLFQFDIQGQE